jgi:hypothetical protein
MKAADLIDEARRKTGLDNFGPDTFREPLERLLDSYNRDSTPTEASDRMAGGTILASLVNRLEIEDWYTRHPEIDEQEIVRPLIGTGMVRTGTTMLANMLLLDPETRSLRRWEAEKPCPPPILGEEANDPRISASERASMEHARNSPGITKIQEIGAQQTTECHPLMFLEFSSQSYEAFLHIPSYMEWLLDPKRDMVPTYKMHKRVLKLLQWRRPPTRWNVKGPGHILFIDALNEVYPDAQFILTHRTPLKAVPSICTLLTAIRTGALGARERAAVGPAAAARWELGLKRLEAFRAKQPASRFHDILHSDIIADQPGELKKVYDWMGWEMTPDVEAAITAWRNKNPRDPHKPKLEDFGLNEADLRARFDFYINGRLKKVTEQSSHARQT